ncbi:MAG: branched-chain amino acid ABC transporter permease [Actinobacteria bacterium]|jgi:branched-chain amino acid transport system permease protein|nr:branched-chain amino acid ABC transporter permease [Actinomycetota bacterium]
MSERMRSLLVLSLAVVIGLVTLALPLVLSSSDVEIYVTIGLATIVVTGLSLLMGFAGQVSLGQAAFYGVGAYTAGIMAVHHWPSLVALMAAPIAAGVIAFVIGVPLLRLKGHALVFSTLAFQLILLVVIENTSFLTGGAIGLSGIPALHVGPLAISTGKDYAYLVWIVAVAVLLITRNLTRSRPGRALRAMAITASGASAAGIAVESYKLKDFTLSAAYAGIAGGIYVFFIGYISPDAFPVTLSIEFVIMVVVGGIGTVSGAFVGAAVVTVISQVLTSLGTSPSLPPDLPTVLSLGVYALILIIILRLIPAGVVGTLSDLWKKTKPSASNPVDTTGRSVLDSTVQAKDG